MWTRISVPFEFGIKDCDSRRQLVIGDVVVADDEVDSESGGIFYFFNSLYSAIQNNNQFDSGSICLVDSLGRNAISLVIAGRDIIFYVGVEILKIFVDKRDGCRAVDVIVAEYHYLLL